MIDIDFLIENESQKCRAEIDFNTVINIEQHYISSYSGSSGGNAWKVTLGKPMKVFSNYEITDFLLDYDLLKAFLHKWSQSI